MHITRSLLGLSLLASTLLTAAYAALTTHHPHAMPNHVMSSNQPLALSIVKVFDEGNKKQVFFQLMDQHHQPVTLNELKTVHTQKIHVLIIDDSLSDYSHVHPLATKQAGIYQLTWQPKDQYHNYTLWTDLTTLNNQQSYLKTPLQQTTLPHAAIDRKQMLESEVNGLKFKLSFNTPSLRAGVAAMGTISIQDASGKPVTNLQPVMGAFAHIVGFGDDLNSIVHIHPMGKEPSHTEDRGGPALMFHLEATKPGFTKLFAQVKINNQELFVPFGLKVNP